MPIDNTLQVTAATFQAGYCPRSNQQLANDIAAGMRVTSTGTFSVINSVDTPDAQYQGAVWNKLDETTGSVLGQFTFNTTYGIWVSYHWPGNRVPTKMRIIFPFSTAFIDAFDGGEAGPVTETTGPFWEEDTSFTDKWPLGRGATNPTPGTNVSVFDVSTPAAPQARGVCFLKPTARIYDRG